MKNALYLFLVLLFGCSPPLSPGMTLLQSLNHYQDEIERFEDKPERWPNRQTMREQLKTQFRAIIGRSREFDRLVDLDFKRRELVITLKDQSLKPERAVEIKEEVAQIDKDVGNLIETVKAQIANVELYAQQPDQRIEAIAAIGLVSLRIEALSSAGKANSSITVAGQHILTDHGNFSTLRTPEGKTYRCSSILLGENAASIKCK